jgi:hypothetical protein
MIYYLECPHCNAIVEIHQNEINCAIFRHGIYKETYQQMNPHTSKEECDHALQTNRIYGCGKPFRMIKEGDNYKLEICDYI